MDAERIEFTYKDDVLQFLCPKPVVNSKTKIGFMPETRFKLGMNGDGVESMKCLKYVGQELHGSNIVG
ncbi:hypothetical protein FF1_041953 [Malus domestica]